MQPRIWFNYLIPLHHSPFPMSRVKDFEQNKCISPLFYWYSGIELDTYTSTKKSQKSVVIAIPSLSSHKTQGVSLWLTKSLSLLLRDKKEPISYDLFGNFEQDSNELSKKISVYIRPQMGPHEEKPHKPAMKPVCACLHGSLQSFFW